jgi:hypothetical protein
MATSSYANLFGTTGAGQQGSKAGISTMFGQQAKPQQQQTPPTPQQTFAQLQQQGMARPAPTAPQAQTFQQYGGSQQAQQARSGMLTQLQQQLAQPTRFNTQAFQQIRGAQASQLGAEYRAQQAQLNEELARRGLSSSTIGAGRMGDLAGQQSRALSELDARLLQTAAETQAQDRLAAMQAGQQFAELAGAQDLAQFEANRVGQAAQFEQGLRSAEFAQGQTEFERGQALAAAQAQQTGGLQGAELGLREKLGLGELTGQVEGQQTLAARQQTEQARATKAQEGFRQTELAQEMQRIQQDAALRGRALTIEDVRRQAEENFRVRELNAADRLAQSQENLRVRELDQADLERKLRQQLGLAEYTGEVDGRETVAVQQQRQQLLIQLASVLAGSKDGLSPQMIADLQEIFKPIGNQP